MWLPQGGNQISVVSFPGRRVTYILADIGMSLAASRICRAPRGGPAHLCKYMCSRVQDKAGIAV